MTSDGDHDPTMGSPAQGVQRDLHACRSLPRLAGVDLLTVGDHAHRPATGHSPVAHLRALLATAERDLARHSHAERLTAAVVRRRGDWRDRLLTDVLRGQESP